MAELLLNNLRTVPRTAEWMIIAPIAFDGQIVKSDYGPAFGTISILGFYTSYEEACQQLKSLLEKHPGQLFMIKKSNYFIPMCQKYENMDIIPLNDEQKITEITRRMIEQQHREKMTEQERKEYLDADRKLAKEENTIQNYVYQKYLRWQMTNQLQDANAQIEKLAQNFSQSELEEHLRIRLQKTGEEHLLPILLN